MRDSSSRSWAVGLICTLWLAGCGQEDKTPEPFFAPDQPGPYRAGHLTGQAPGPDELQLPVQLWYPAASGAEQELDYDGLGLTHGRVVPGGPPACDRPRPVVIFSHGNSGISYQTYSLTEHLARHGFVVAAPDHVHNTFFEGDDSLWAALVMRRPLDVAATFDWLVGDQAAAGPGGPLAGCVDPQAGYAVMGHSFGGFTTLAVAGAPLDIPALEAACEGDEGAGCQVVAEWAAAHPDQLQLDRSDPRVWAAVSLAPAWHQMFGEGLSAIAVPILVVGGEIDSLTTWSDDVLPVYEALEAVPRDLAELEGAGHYSFTDFCPVVGSDFNGCGPDARPVDEVLATLRTLTLAFLLRAGGDERAADWLPPEEGVDLWEGVEE